MMFTLEAIEWAVEAAVMLVEEKVALCQEEIDRKKWSRREAEEEQEMEENPSDENETADNSLDDFDEYLRECALGMLSPFGKQNDDEIQEELKTIVQAIESKLSEEDKKEIMDSLKNKNLCADIKGLLGIQDEG